MNKNKLIFIFVTYILSLFISIPSYSAEILILPWPKNDSRQDLGDFTEGIELSLKYSTSHVVLNIWSWERFEKEFDEFNIKKEFGGARYLIDKGLKDGQYYGITVIDTVKRVLPHDIDENIDWDSPDLLERYKRVILEFSKELDKQPNYFIIANEADVYFEKNPDEFQKFVEFVRNSKKIIKDVFPNTQVGVSLTFEGLIKGGKRKNNIIKLIEISDAMFMTYYPVFDFKPTPAIETLKHLDLIIATANEKKIVLQEVGYPSGLNGDLEEAQANFFRTIIPAIKSNSQIEFASIFALHDFDKKTCSHFTSYYGFTGFLTLSPLTKKFQDFLCSLGLRKTDGTPKPAWDAVIQSLNTKNPAE
jgi:hypothetical protein